MRESSSPDPAGMTGVVDGRERVVIIDSAQTYYISPLLQFSEAKDLHAQQAELATVTFLRLDLIAARRRGQTLFQTW